MNAMSNSDMFKQAHTMAKQIIREGDCYRAVFGQCLRWIIRQEKAKRMLKQCKPNKPQRIDYNKALDKAAMVVFLAVVFTTVSIVSGLCLDYLASGGTVGISLIGIVSVVAAGACSVYDCLHHMVGMFGE